MNDLVNNNIQHEFLGQFSSQCLMGTGTGHVHKIIVKGVQMVGTRFLFDIRLVMCWRHKMVRVLNSQGRRGRLMRMDRREIQTLGRCPEIVMRLVMLMVTHLAVTVMQPYLLLLLLLRIMIHRRRQ